MIIQVIENLSLEVDFDPADRGQGFEDGIRFRIYESGLKTLGYSRPMRPVFF